MVSIPKDNSQQRYIYKSFENCDNDLYFFPPTKKVYDKAPVLFMMPGGGWNRNRAMAMYDGAKIINDILRDKGFAVATISYRGCVDDEVSMSEEVADILDGIGFLAKYQDVLQIDPMRVYTFGHSAGAHLSLTVAYMNKDCVTERRIYPKEQFCIKGVAGMSSPTTFMPENMDLYYLDMPYFDKLFPLQNEEIFSQYSPLCLAEKHSVPTFLIHGDKDDLIDCKHSVLLYEKLKEKGEKTELVVCKNANHCFQSPTGEDINPTLDEAKTRAAQFILSCEE